MSKLLKKLIFSFLISIFLFGLSTFIAKHAFAARCLTNIQCSSDPTLEGCVPNPLAGDGQHLSHLCGEEGSGAVTTQIGNTVQNALQGSSNIETWYNQGFLPWYVKVYDDLTSPPNEIFGERYTAAQVQWVVYGLLSMPINLLGKDMRDYVVCTMKLAGPDSVSLGQCATGAIQFLTKIVGIISPLSSSPNQTSIVARVFDTSNRPISGIGYIKEKISKFSLVKVAHAQSGFGYGHLGIAIPYWSAARDIAYVISVIAVIVFAFMIMFRVKISPQAVITVQSALPKLIIALVLATFSFAIAGLVIDLLYVVSGIFATVLAASGVASSVERAYITIVGEFGSTGTFLGNILGGPITIFLVMLVYTLLFFFSVIWNAFTSIAASLSLVAGSGFTILGVILLVWVFILSFIYTIKIPWVLFKTTINIYISIIVAPLQIMLGTLIPSLGFGQWLKNLIANILVFPVTGVLIFLAYDFLMFSFTAGTVVGADGLVNAVNAVFGTSIKIGNQSTGAINLWSPPYLGGDITGFIFLIISFGIIVLIPKVADFLKAIIMGEKFSYGTAIGEALGPINWARGQVMRSPAALALQEAAGATAAANILERMGQGRVGKNILRATQRFTGVSDENAMQIAKTLRAKAQGVETQRGQGGRQG